MARLEQSVIMNREAQTSDAALFRKDLPKAGCYSAIDIECRLTVGSTNAVNMDLLDVIKHISLVCNGNDYRVHISGQEAFRHYWMKHGKPMPYTWTERDGEVNSVWFRIEFGRFVGDEQFGLNLAKFNNVQVQIDYDAVTAWGAAAATTFVTGTFTVSIIAHQFPYNKQPAFKGMLGLREFYTTTTTASGDIVEDLPSSNPVLAVSVMCIEDAIADAVDITDIEIGKDNFSTSWLKGKWYNFAQMQNNELSVREELFALEADDAQTRDTHLTAIKSGIAVCKAITTAIA